MFATANPNANEVSKIKNAGVSLPECERSEQNPKKSEHIEPKSKIISYFSGLVVQKTKKLIINLLKT